MCQIFPPPPPRRAEQAAPLPRRPAADPQRGHQLCPGALHAVGQLLRPAGPAGAPPALHDLHRQVSASRGPHKRGLTGTQCVSCSAGLGLGLLVPAPLYRAAGTVQGSGSTTRSCAWSQGWDANGSCSLCCNCGPAATSGTGPALETASPRSTIQVGRRVRMKRGRRSLGTDMRPFALWTLSRPLLELLLSALCGPCFIVLYCPVPSACVQAASAACLTTATPACPPPQRMSPGTASTWGPSTSCSTAQVLRSAGACLGVGGGGWAGLGWCGLRVFRRRQAVCAGSHAPS